jgi:hypothetical protein
VRRIDLTYVNASTARAVGRRAREVSRRGPRLARSAFAKPEEFSARPPVLVNSFPKSGTHLLWPVALALPGAFDYGTFLVSLPPPRYVPLSPRVLAKRLGHALPGEAMRGHLWFSDAYRDALREKNVLCLFMHRDLRDVVVSEAHFLGEMAPWHALHAHYKTRRTLGERVMLAIRGLQGTALDYPNVGDRFRKYAGWLGESDATVRFEDLRGPAAEAEISRIGDVYAEHTGRPIERDAFVASALVRAEPHRSPTYRTSQVGGWREVFDDAHRDAFKAAAGEMLIELGYERDLNW